MDAQALGGVARVVDLPAAVVEHGDDVIVLRFGQGAPRGRRAGSFFPVRGAEGENTHDAAADLDQQRQVGAQAVLEIELDAEGRGEGTMLAAARLDFDEEGTPRSGRSTSTPGGRSRRFRPGATRRGPGSSTSVRRWAICASGLKGSSGAAIWLDAGIQEAEASGWRRLGLDPSGALPWRRRGFSSADRAEWTAAGFELEDAYAWRSRGFDVAVATAERGRGQSADQALARRRFVGLEPHEPQGHKAILFWGLVFTAPDRLPWRDDGVERYADQWRERFRRLAPAGVDPGDAGCLVDAYGKPASLGTYFVGVEESIVEALDGRPRRFDAPEAAPGWDDRLRRFCDVMRIPFEDKPTWWLTATLWE